jgi:hypothetical protein
MKWAAAVVAEAEAAGAMKWETGASTGRIEAANGPTAAGTVPRASREPREPRVATKLPPMQANSVQCGFGD